MTVQINVENKETYPFDLHFDEWTWTGPTLEEGDFPLVAEVEGKRYELYFDNTFDEVEL
jgi:hypothetical protein